MTLFGAVLFTCEVKVFFAGLERECATIQKFINICRGSLQMLRPLFRYSC